VPAASPVAPRAQVDLGMSFESILVPALDVELFKTEQHHDGV